MLGSFINRGESSKRILILSRSFFPMNTPRSFRTTELAKQFVKDGYNVTVITHYDSNHHVEFSKKYGIEICDFGAKKFNSIDISGNRVSKSIKRIISRILGLLFEYPNITYLYLVRKALRRQIGYDVLISIASPHSIHWGVAFMFDRRVAKVWIADCGDPFMGRESDTFKPLFYFKYLEKYFCKKTDFITVPTFNSIDAYYPEFKEKIRVIPQGFNFDDFPSVSRFDFNFSKPKFIYAGSFIPGLRDPTELFEYLISIKADYLFVVYTKTPFYYKKYENLSNSRIIIKDAISRELLLQELATADFLVNMENTGTHETPSKLIEYAILGKPILSIKTNNLRRDLVDEFLAGDFSRRTIIDNIDQYNIENVTSKFEQLFVN